jgi:hypothetical protein
MSAGPGRIQAVLEKLSNVNVMTTASKSESEILQTRSLLAKQTRELPDALARAFKEAHANAHLAAPVSMTTQWIVTGVGASEGPARLLASTLRDVGFTARFASVTYFLGKTPPRGDVLVVVSQKLSPNGCIPLAHTAAFTNTILVTSVVEPAQALALRSLTTHALEVVLHGPEEDEGGLFLRVLGPSLAAAACVALAVRAAKSAGFEEPAWWSARSKVAENTRAILQRGHKQTPGVLAFLAAGENLERIFGAKSKLIEGLGYERVSFWDTCGFVHGPFQSVYGTHMTLLLASEKDDVASQLLWQRLLQILPAKHETVHFESELSGPLAYFAYDAHAFAWVAGCLEQNPRSLLSWPGQNADGAIYELSAPIA